MNRPLPTLCLVLAILALGACDRRSNFAVGQTAWDRLELISEAAEPITEIAVREGEQVQSGTVILRQQPRLYAARLEQATAARDLAQSRLAELQRGPRQELREQARARLAGARSRRQNAELQLERSLKLVADKLASRAEADQATAARDSAAAEVDALAAELESLLQGTTLEELQQAKAALQQTQARVRELQILQQRLTVTAPREGVIDALPFEPGERPAPGATVAVMLVGEGPFARIYLPEPFRVRIAVGDLLPLHIDGLEGIVEGRVRYISSDPAFTPFFALTEHDRSRLSYLAEIEFELAGGKVVAAGVPVQVDLTELAGE